MTDVDLVVLGAGIQGVGVAQAATAAGYRVLVLEKNEVGSGTSSRSTKLIHGGLRYLETGQFHLVFQAIRERELLLKLAPELIHRLPFYLPVYKKSIRPAWMIKLGLLGYDLFSSFTDAPWSERLREQHWPKDGLITEALSALFVYTDAQTDDALLTRSVMQSAESMGAILACPARFISAETQSDGCKVQFSDSAGLQSITCLGVVNAMGPWGVSSADRFTPAAQLIPMELVEGTHIECPDAQLTAGYYLESPGDQRGVFVLPWKQTTLVGTTESIYRQSPDELVPTPEAIDYLQGVYKHYFPSNDHRVLNAWSGLRVLPQQQGKPFSRSRETQLLCDLKRNPRVVHVLGGKLTTYRLTALQVLGLLSKVLPPAKPIATTAELPLHPVA